MVKAYGIIEKNDKTFLVLERLDQKSEQAWNDMSDKTLLTYVLQALSIIQSWKQQGKKHEDIKHDNMGFRKKNNQKDDELVFIDPLPRERFARGGYGGGPDEVNAMRSLLNSRLSLKRKNLLNIALKSFIKDFLKPLCNAIDIKNLNTPKVLKDEEYRSKLEKRLYANFMNEVQNDLSNHLPEEYPTEKLLTEKSSIPQKDIVCAYLGLNMEIKHFDKIRDLDQKKIKEMWNDGIKQKAEKMRYYGLESYEQKSDTPIGLIEFKFRIVHIQTYSELEKNYTASREFRPKRALSHMAYDNLIEELPLYQLMVDIIREKTTIEEAIEQIKENIQRL